MVPLSAAPIETILQFVARDLHGLLVRHHYRIVDSLVSTSNGGDAYVEIATKSVVIRLCCDRGCYCILVRSPEEHPYEYFDGHSIDIIRRLLNPEHNSDDASMSKENATFLCESAKQLRKLFSKRVLPSTLKAIRVLKVARSKRMFPPSPKVTKKVK